MDGARQGVKQPSAKSADWWGCGRVQIRVRTRAVGGCGVLADFGHVGVDVSADFKRASTSSALGDEFARGSGSKRRVCEGGTRKGGRNGSLCQVCKTWRGFRPPDGSEQRFCKGSWHRTTVLQIGMAVNAVFAREIGFGLLQNRHKLPFARRFPTSRLQKRHRPPFARKFRGTAARTEGKAANRGRVKDHSLRYESGGSSPSTAPSHEAPESLRAACLSGSNNAPRRLVAPFKAYFIPGQACWRRAS